MYIDDGTWGDQMCLWGGPPVNPFQWPVSEEEWMTLVVFYPNSLFEVLNDCLPPGSCGKMSQGCFPPTEEPLSANSFPVWNNAGTAWRGEWLTLSAGSPSGEKESSLSDIWETGAHLSQFCLSPRAAQGMLRRAEGKGVTMDRELRAVLMDIAARELQDQNLD